MTNVLTGGPLSSLLGNTVNSGLTSPTTPTSGVYVTSVNSTSTTSGVVFYTGGSGSTANYINVSQNFAIQSRQAKRVSLGGALYDVLGSLLEIAAGEEMTIKLPDESAIFIEADGSYRLIDKHARVVRKGFAQREFNRFVNASDLLEQFIKDLGLTGVKQDQVLNVPIELFINWLIVKAAEQDGDPVPQDVPKLQQAVKSKVPKCKCCGRFVNHSRAEAGLLFCNSDHYTRYEQRYLLRVSMPTTQATPEKTQ